MPADLVGLLDDENPDLPARLEPHLGPRLAALLPRMGKASQFNLMAGLAAMHLTGVAGSLTIDLPAQASGRVEVVWVPGPRSTS